MIAASQQVESAAFIHFMTSPAAKATFIATGVE